jgi:hypothetical protein
MTTRNSIMRIASLPAYFNDAREAFGVVMIVIVAVVAPVLVLLVLGRVLHRLERGLVWVAGRR